ncbi:hypothetical protein [Paraburkholderia bannensis]|uniref:hypothetical protein n=1 Tax=Paraburkholderia bannensis TaxID=765414 RepID=UPI002AC321AA|nr:hypothetical protein [Paraburkholderia bannensis]
MTIESIAQRWIRFEKAVISIDAPPIQRSEMRLAFYAGVKTMLDVCLELGELPQSLAVVLLHAFHEESRRFGATLGDSAPEDADDDS